MAKPESIEKLIKAGSIRYGNDPALQIKWLPSNLPAFDSFLGKGIPLGKIVELYGPQSTGKTLVAQHITTAIQKSENPDVLYVDLEDSYDQEWWQLSGVDTNKLMISKPVTGEDAIDIMVAVVLGLPTLGGIIVDSIAAMSPAIDQDPDRSAEEKSMGAQAKLITKMFHKLKGLIQDTSIVLLLTNQMRSNLGQTGDEVSVLPGGWANRHFTHVLLRTRREGWINSPSDSKEHIGFNIEIVNRKNKLANTADGDSIILPYYFKSQIDFLLAYISEAENKKFIVRAGPTFKWADQVFKGREPMRDYFRDNPDKFEILKEQLFARQQLPQWSPSSSGEGPAEDANPFSQ